MLKIISVSAVAALALAVTVTSQPASARGGAIAAGIIGGIFVLLFLAAAMAGIEGTEDQR